MIHLMKSNLTGNQFGIYWTRVNVSKALSSSNGNVCISLSTQNIDYKKWENQMVDTFVNVIYAKMKQSPLFICFEGDIQLNMS